MAKVGTVRSIRMNKGGLANAKTPMKLHFGFGTKTARTPRPKLGGK